MEDLEQSLRQEIISLFNAGQTYSALLSGINSSKEDININQIDLYFSLYGNVSEVLALTRFYNRHFSHDDIKAIQERAKEMLEPISRLFLINARISAELEAFKRDKK